MVDLPVLFAHMADQLLDPLLIRHVAFEVFVVLQAEIGGRPGYADDRMTALAVVFGERLADALSGARDQGNRTIRVSGSRPAHLATSSATKSAKVPTVLKGLWARENTASLASAMSFFCERFGSVLPKPRGG